MADLVVVAPDTRTTIPLPDFEDDFNVDNWTTSDAAFLSIDTGDKELNFLSDGVLSGNDFIFIDMIGETISDTLWSVRCELTYTVLTQGGDNTPNSVAISLTSLAVGPRTVCDNVNFLSSVSAVIGKFRMGTAAHDNDQVLISNPTEEFTTTSTVRTFGFELIRLTATTFKCTLYEDATFGIEVESINDDVSAAVIGLRFANIGVENSDSTANGEERGFLKKWQFWNDLDISR